MNDVAVHELAVPDFAARHPAALEAAGQVLAAGRGGHHLRLILLVLLIVIVIIVVVCVVYLRRSRRDRGES